MTVPDPSESRRLAALAAVVRDAVKAPSSAELDRGLAELRVRLAPFRQGASVRARQILYVAAALSCVVVTAVVVPRFANRSTPLEAPVALSGIEGGKMLEGGYLSEVGQAGVRLRFNEGSEFVLTSGTRGRLREITANGARFALDHGTASFRIQGSRERRWWVEAGPFSVAVRGTDFTVVWDPAREEFDVKLRQGHVAVSGPVIGAELLLRPGQELSVNLPKSETLITQSRHEPLPGPLASSASPPGSASTHPVVSSLALSALAAKASESASAVAAERRWSKALANGEWDRILADVEREGVEASLRTLSSDELFILADAARYRRRPELARAALLAQRERFPNSPPALDALFLLDRVEELGGGGRAAAPAR